MIDETDLHSAVAAQRQQPHVRMGDLMVAAGKLPEDDLYQALSEQLGVPYVHLGDFDVDPVALANLPQELLPAQRVLPLMLHEGRLVVATDDPADNSALSTLRFRAQRPIEAVLASPTDLDAAIAVHYPPLRTGRCTRKQIACARRHPLIAGDNSGTARGAKTDRTAGEQPPAQCGAAPRLGHPRAAAGTHAEARYRIDGTLQLIGEFGAALVPAIVARIKVLASMDVAERRLPQDGAIHLDTPNGQVDMRVSIMPAIFGENVVIRILDRNVGLRRLDDIGFPAATGSASVGSSIVIRD